ncbi:hypothetical protein PINS_up008437 [Pythium insidiosum]|nr:hypothetical protein PINS_up008437 [Pythium insidiosum]
MTLQRLAFENRELLCGDASSAICNFGEKNDDVVRIGGDDRASLSSEFYGGTHVADASAVFTFVVVSEGSVAAGTRRVEAVAGVVGAKHLQITHAFVDTQYLLCQSNTPRVPTRNPGRVARNPSDRHEKMCMRPSRDVVRASGNVLTIGGSIVVSANALQPLLPTSTSYYSGSASSPSSWLLQEAIGGPDHVRSRRRRA